MDFTDPCWARALSPTLSRLRLIIFDPNGKTCGQANGLKTLGFADPALHGLCSVLVINIIVWVAINVIAEVSPDNDDLIGVEGKGL